MSWVPSPDVGDNAKASLTRRRGRIGTTLAAWIARKHFLVDSSVREIAYLPNGAPADEIRLIEVNERLASPEKAFHQVDAINFAMDIQGCPFRLFVADVDGDQLEQIKEGRLSLPTGWTLDGNITWGRRG